MYNHARLQIRRMNNPQPFKAPKVFDIDRQQLLHAMDIHARHQAGIMDLYTLNTMRHQKRPPSVVHFLAIWKKLKIAFNDQRQSIRFGDGQSEPILVKRASRDVPKFTKSLRCDASIMIPVHVLS